MFNSIRSTFIFALALFACCLAANAQATVYVGPVTGSDANACSSSAPCKTVTKAMSVVNPSGKIVLTESGEYDGFKITKAVTVEGAPGVSATILPDGGVIAWATPTVKVPDVITFRNLHFAGNGRTDIGINNNYAGTVNIDNCIFTGLASGISNYIVAGFVFIHDSTFRDNAYGIAVLLLSGEGTTRVVIDHCRVESNEDGIDLEGKVLTEIRNSVIADNKDVAISAVSAKARFTNDLLIENCEINHNRVGLLAYPTNSGIVYARLSRSSFTNGMYGVIATGATVYTLGNNIFSGNFNDIANGVFTPFAPK